MLMVIMMQVELTLTKCINVTFKKYITYKLKAYFEMGY